MQPTGSFGGPILTQETLPGNDTRSDEQLLDYAMAKGVSGYHLVGTCRMGSDALAVVDSRLRAHGIGRLRVADASIMPTIVGANTNAATVMIGEKAADLIRSAR